VTTVTTPLLTTKLYIPPPRPDAVHRPRLVERLNEGLRGKLTLVAAPAGFGKTTLVSEWLAGRGRPAAWLSLDEGDNDPARFLMYLVSALRTVVADVGGEALATLQAPQTPPIEALLTTLLNDLAAVADELVLVLDDYHTLDSRPVDEALTFLIERLPAQAHLVITTREDPRLPLARLRAKGQLTELRAADLRFTAEEAAAFLNAGMGLRLAAADIAALEARTEGWIAGLQLAALSLRGRQDAHGFIQAFAGDHRYIVDYLVDEVLARQTEPVRGFLLQTAILDRLYGPLCDAVTGQEGGAARLEALERGAFFVVPLDDQRCWYRYHHLFADVLHVRLLAERPEQVATLHRRASAWFERQGTAAEAIRHALAAGEAEDLARAADLIERAMPALRQSRQEVALLGWLRALPDELLRRRPVLSAWYAHALLASGELEGVERRLRDAERWLDMALGEHERLESSAAEMVVVDEEAYHRLPGTIAVARAGTAMALGDVADTIRYARQALDLTLEDDHLGRGAAAGFLGLASWASGDLEAGYVAYAECMTRMRRAGHVSDALGCAIALADIRIAQGRPRDAMRTYERAAQLAAEQGEPVPRGLADMYVGMSAIRREWNDLQAAAESLERSQELGERAGLAQNPYRWRVAMARIRATQGDLDGALDLLREAERRYVSDFFPNVRPIAALVTRVWIAHGRVDEALGWAREQGLNVSDDLSYLREYEHITLARALLVQYERDHDDHALEEALGLLERLLEAAEAGERAGSVIEILALLALGRQARGDIPAALGALRQALALAEPEGYVRLFVDEGPAMTRLLEAAAKRRIAPHYLPRLLSAAGSAGDQASVNQGLIEPLSDRELDVLRLLSADLDGPEIARELTVSLNTVRTHTKHIYSKLGVNSRLAAVRRAEELGILSRGRKH
jgi:ATP/maltotriose-dependent transcriptional regulator MalT